MAGFGHHSGVVQKPFSGWVLALRTLDLEPNCGGDRRLIDTAPTSLPRADRCHPGLIQRPPSTPEVISGVPAGPDGTTGDVTTGPTNHSQRSSVGS